jgi:hypothetical protein
MDAHPINRACAFPHVNRHVNFCMDPHGHAWTCKVGVSFDGQAILVIMGLARSQLEVNKECI